MSTLGLNFSLDLGGRLMTTLSKVVSGALTSSDVFSSDSADSSGLVLSSGLVFGRIWGGGICVVMSTGDLERLLARAFGS
jgi:hypothetical protein